MDTEIITAIIGSSVISSLLTTLFGKITSDKAIKIDNITKERKEWRDKLRELTLETTKAFRIKGKKKLQEIETELTVRLNPSDEDDKGILVLIRKLSNEISTLDDLKNFNDSMSFLLKHDWERVKIETTTHVSAQTLALATVCSFLFIFIINLFVQVFELKYFLFVSILLLIFFLMPVLFGFLWDFIFIKRKCTILKKFGYFMINAPQRLSNSKINNSKNH